MGGFVVGEEIRPTKRSACSPVQVSMPYPALPNSLFPVQAAVSCQRCPA